MNKITITTIVLCLQCLYSFSQELQYEYDAAGNRVEVRIIELRQSKKSLIEEELLIVHDFGPREFKIYPVPTKGDLVIGIFNGDEKENYIFQLTDLSGRYLLSANHQGNGSVLLNLEPYPPGFYILVVKTIDGNLNYKIIKE